MGPAMKVGIVVPFSWSYPGGVIAHAEGQARALAQLGATAKVLCGYDPPGAFTCFAHGRAGRRERPPGHVTSVGRSIGVPANGSIAHVVLSPMAVWRLARSLEREQFDVLHVHDPLCPALPVAALAVAECPLIATVHCSGSRWASLGSRAWGFLTERIDHRIAVSEQARRAASRYLRGQIEILPNGVDLPLRSDPASRRHHVVFVGRADRRKGLDTLLRAWPGVRRATGARLRLVGVDTRLVRGLMQRLEAPADGVDALGVISDDAVLKEIASARVLAAPSNGGESFGIVLVQAFACATPVVCSDISGFREVADPTASVRVAPGDPIALRDALLTVLQKEALREALGSSARRIAERYAWPRIAARLLEVYESLVQRPSLDPRVPKSARAGPGS
jgi:phosphatidyl-myo-inositol alpha-mannosyltransferase